MKNVITAATHGGLTSAQQPEERGGDWVLGGGGECAGYLGVCICVCVPTRAGALTHKLALPAGSCVRDSDLDLDAVPGAALQVRQGHAVLFLVVKASGLQGATEDSGCLVDFLPYMATSGHLLHLAVLPVGDAVGGGGKHLF